MQLKRTASSRSSRRSNFKHDSAWFFKSILCEFFNEWKQTAIAIIVDYLLDEGPVLQKGREEFSTISPRMMMTMMMMTNEQPEVGTPRQMQQLQRAEVLSVTVIVSIRDTTYNVQTMSDNELSWQTPTDSETG